MEQGRDLAPPRRQVFGSAPAHARKPTLVRCRWLGALQRAAWWAVVPALAVAWWVPPPVWSGPEWRLGLLLAVTVVAWALEVLPDWVIALGLLSFYNLAGLGPASVSLSGFASPTWFLLVGLLGVAAGVTRSRIPHRLALRLLLLFPPTFRGQALAVILSGLLITPLFPLTVGRCALIAPLTLSLTEMLGYPPWSQPAVGIGLAAFVGTGLMSWTFLSGAALNLIADSLLPPGARVGWALWVLAAASTSLVILGGSLAIIPATFRPAGERRFSHAAIAARLRALGPLSRGEWLAGEVTVAVLVGFLMVPRLGVENAWIALAGALVLAGAGVLTREDLRSAVDWPLLLLLGVMLSVPAMVHQAGLDTRIAAAMPLALGWAHASPVRGIALVFLLTVGVRFLLSEWVGVPFLTVAFLAASPRLSLHPWVVAFVVLVGAKLWIHPYQSSAYLVFWGACDGRLFNHRQVRAFSVIYLTLCLLGLLVSIPLWRLLGLVG